MHTYSNTWQFITIQTGLWKLDISSELPSSLWLCNHTVIFLRFIHLVQIMLAAGSHCRRCRSSSDRIRIIFPLLFDQIWFPPSFSVWLHGSLSRSARAFLKRLSSMPKLLFSCFSKNLLLTTHSKMTSIKAIETSNHFMLLFFCFDFHSKRCTRSSWRTATCTSSTSAIYPWSPFLFSRRAGWPACGASDADAGAKPHQTIFKDWLHNKQAMWNIPQPYLAFSQAVSPLIGHELRMIRKPLRRTWHHEIVSESFSCRHSRNSSRRLGLIAQRQIGTASRKFPGIPLPRCVKKERHEHNSFEWRFYFFTLI